MKLEGRSLALGMQGDDVREVQRDLRWLGFSLIDEPDAARFGKSTRAAVQQFQKQNRLQPTGVVDSKTAAAINKRLAGLKRVVCGTLRQADGKPLQRARIRAFDKELRTETNLGEAACTATGYFEISYQFKTRDRVAPNIVVKKSVCRDTNPVAISSPVFEPAPEINKPNRVQAGSGSMFQKAQDQSSPQAALAYTPSLKGNRYAD